MADTQSTLMQAPTPGIKSSEFLATVATIASVVLGAIPQQYVPLVVGATGVYVACRTLLKTVHALGYAKSVPDLPALPPLPAGTTQTTITQVPKV